MSGAAKARNKTRPKRGPMTVRAVEVYRPDVGEPSAARPAGGRGAVPGQRPVPGYDAEPAVPGREVCVAVESPASASALEPTAGPGGTFARGYPAPADAVRCAMLGSPPTFWFDGDAGRLTIAVESGRLVASGVVHIGEDLAQLVAAVLLNHDGEPADAVEPVRAALAELAVLAGHADAEVTVDLSGRSPRLGWLSRFDPAPWVTWHDWWSSFAASAAARTAAAVRGAAGPGEVDDCLRRQGLRVWRCAEPGCGAPLTDRHPAWPGVWSAASGQFGPVCAVSAAGQSWPAGLLTARPHRVAEG